jgi:ATP-dependent Clp protease adaptor protein ClpS
VDAVYFALVAAGMGALWWRHLRVQQGAMQLRSTPRALGTVFDGDAEVALHVAAHEARSRGEVMTSLHILYGLLQDEQISTALREIGSDPSALEDRALLAMDERRPRERDRAHDDSEDDDRSEHEDVHRVYGFAAGHASNAGRRATATDLWAYLRGSEAAKLVGMTTVSRVLFRLCHGSVEESVVRIEGHLDVHVVLRNDDYTTQQFVCSVLEGVFRLDAEEANVRMMQTHTQGRAIIGRFRPEEARAKIEEARGRARAGGFPLWIGVEPI